MVNFLEGEACAYIRQRSSMFPFWTWLNMKEAMLIRFGAMNDLERIKLHEKNVRDRHKSLEGFGYVHPCKVSIDAASLITKGSIDSAVLITEKSNSDEHLQHSIGEVCQIYKSIPSKMQNQVQNSLYETMPQHFRCSRELNHRVWAANFDGSHTFGWLCKI